MIVALWLRWTKDRRLRWLALVLAVIAVDLAVGSALLAWELRTLEELLR